MTTNKNLCVENSTQRFFCFFKNIVQNLAPKIREAIITIAIWAGIIILICKYLAKQISMKFDYDRLAKRTAEEICKRMLIIEKQRAEAKEIEPEGEGSDA